MEVTTDEPNDPRGDEVKAAFSSGVEEVVVPRMEDIENFPGPARLK